jgi:hypothetical protein
MTVTNTLVKNILMKSTLMKSTLLKRIYCMALMALLALASSQSWATLSATADRTIIDSNETLQLLVRLDSQALMGEPDFTVIESNFEILSTSRQQQYSRVNGQTQSYTDWNLLLAPKRTGRLLVPSIKYKKDISNAIEITVRKASAASAAGQPVYTETLVDKSEVYIQEQLLLTHRLYTSVRLSDLGLDPLKADDTVMQKVSETQFQKNVAGKNYQVVEIVYALFPQASGKLQIPALRFSAYEASNNRYGGFSARGNRIIRSTDAKTINVMARPDTIDIDNWMPASSIRLDQQWSSPLDQLKVGEPITRNISITAKGLTGAQIMPLSLSESDDYKIYPDQPQLDDSADATGVTGIRRESFALVPNRSGEIILPAVTVRWWDTVRQRMQTAKLKAVTLQVTAAEVSKMDPYNIAPKPPAGANTLPRVSAPETPKSLTAELRSSLPLQLSLAGNALLMLMLLFFWLRRSSTAAPRRDLSGLNTARLELKQLITNIERAARKSDLAPLRDSILAWGRCIFPQQKIKALAEIATLLHDTELQQQFDLLDQALYNNGSEQQPDLKLLVNLIRNAIVPKTDNPQTAKAELKPLYPSS